MNPQRCASTSFFIIIVNVGRLLYNFSWFFFEEKNDICTFCFSSLKNYSFGKNSSMMKTLAGMCLTLYLLFACLVVANSKCVGLHVKMQLLHINLLYKVVKL